jgi:hypothetical protein
MLNRKSPKHLDEKRSCIDKPPELILYALIKNIPLDFHTPDLRNFFSHSIESESFVCFNYRHRPDSANSSSSSNGNMCICKVKANKFDELMKLYDGKNWIDSRGLIRQSKCSIGKIKADSGHESSLGEKELNELLEFKRIPEWMPQGNVGTPTKSFLVYINQCVMPQSLISKLGLNMKMLRKYKKKKYTNVSYSYESERNEDDEDEAAEANDAQSTCVIDVARTANGQAIEEEIDNENEVKRLNYEKLDERRENNAKEESDDEHEDFGDHLQEWERHEAFNDDVTKQDRTSPYFFEEEIELKWEKGGSGLVFYTVSKLNCVVLSHLFPTYFRLINFY